MMRDVRPPEAFELRVLLLGRAPIWRMGLRTLLEGVFVVVESGDADAIIVTNDTALGDAQLALERAPQAALIALVDEGGQAQRWRSLEPNGFAALPSDADAETLQSAIRAVTLGLIVLAPEFSEALNTTAVFEPIKEHLTPRELEVLALMSDGLSNKVIARRLEIGESTVKFHVSAIIAKLRASSRTDAVGRGLRAGLIAL
jgi:DNA-binding NarL/FixJ family response regulator